MCFFQGMCKLLCNITNQIVMGTRMQFQFIRYIYYLCSIIHNHTKGSMNVNKSTTIIVSKIT